MLSRWPLLFCFIAHFAAADTLLPEGKLVIAHYMTRMVPE